MTGKDAPDLLLGGNGIGAGAGALAADVDDVGALLGQGETVLDGPAGVENGPPSENESGVTLTMPMIQVRRPRRNS